MVRRRWIVFASIAAACSDPASTATVSDTEVSTSTSDTGSTTPSTSAESSSGSDTTCVVGCTSADASTSSETTSPDSSGTTATDSSEGSSSSAAPDDSSSGSVPELCGNGSIDAGEDCDDAGESATCDDDCTFVACPDGNHNAAAGEQCDVGGEGFSCDADCTFPVCGDGIVNESDNEICDDGGPTPTCDPDCTPVSCGDGTQNLAALETCDDGNNESNDGCSSTCVIEGDFGGRCVIVAGVQWCYDDDHCGEACNDVCERLGLTIEPSDATWFAAQDSAPECQAISDALQLDVPIDFGAHEFGCLQDSGLAALTGGGLTGALMCSSDPACPAAHRVDMDDIGTGCDLPDARRSVCPCAGEFCGNGVVEGLEVCDDGNQVENDGCTTSCVTTPPTCVVVGDQQWCYDDQACGQACEDVCAALGLPLGISDEQWSAAQDTIEECQAISDAFGFAQPVQFDSFTYACMEDSGANDQVGGGLTGPLFCSNDAACPSQHRTQMDQLGIPCGQPAARRSICPCG